MSDHTHPLRRGLANSQALHVERDRGDAHHPLESVARAPEWMDGREHCAQADPEVFYPLQGSPATAAKAICADCPLKQPCLEYAIEHRERHGVWGGHTERERRGMRKGSAA